MVTSFSFSWRKKNCLQKRNHSSDLISSSNNNKTLIWSSLWIISTLQPMYYHHYQHPFPKDDSLSSLFHHNLFLDSFRTEIVQFFIHFQRFSWRKYSSSFILQEQKMISTFMIIWTGNNHYPKYDHLFS